MSLFLSIILSLVFGGGVLFAVANICCMAHNAYLCHIVQDGKPHSCLPPLGGALMCIALYCFSSSHFLLPLLVDYPFPLLLIIPAVKAYRLVKG